MKRSSLLITAALVAVSLAAGGALAAWSRGPAAAEAKFKGSGTGGFKLEGKTSEVDVKDDGKIFTVVVQLKNLTTGISLRDSHMRDKYLEVGKFPETTLAVPFEALKIPDNGKDGEGDAKGQVTLHGVTREQAFHYKGACSKEGLCDVTGTLPLNFNDFGIQVPKYLGITVKPEVTVTTTFQVRRP